MKFGIIGHGRFGKLWAECLKPWGDVLIYDKNQSKADQPRADNKNKLEEVVNTDILFLLVPISEIGSVCEEIKSILPSSTLVVDACSVKIFPSLQMKKILKNHKNIIATHPLFGPDSVKIKGLENHKIVVCDLGAEKSKQEILEELFKKLKLNIIKTTPEEHDKQMAKSQALVHFLGRGLEGLNLEPQEISTPDYTSLLKMNSMVENDTWQLFLDMQEYNPYAKEMRELFLKNLEKINKSICK